jgi:hypothetical protein
VPSSDVRPAAHHGYRFCKVRTPEPGNDIDGLGSHRQEIEA